MHQWQRPEQRSVWRQVQQLLGVCTRHSAENCDQGRSHISEDPGRANGSADAPPQSTGPTATRLALLVVAFKAEGDIFIPAELTAAAAMARRALMNLDARITADDGVRILGRTGGSGGGEVVSIELTDTEGGTAAHLRSCAVIRTGVLDFGKHGRTVRRLSEDFDRGAPLATGRAAYGEPTVDPRFRWLGIPISGVALVLGIASADNPGQRTFALWCGLIAAVLAIAAPASKALRIRRRGQVRSRVLVLTQLLIEYLVFFTVVVVLSPRRSPVGVSASLFLSAIVISLCGSTLLIKTVVTVRGSIQPRDQN